MSLAWRSLRLGATASLVFRDLCATSKNVKVAPEGLSTMLDSYVRRLVIGLGLASMSMFAFPESTLAQQKPKLRPLHIALANHSVSMTAIYVAKRLGIF